MNDGSIGSTFNEGHMKVEGEDAYCIDINTDFHDKDFKVNPEQAETVKLIYKLFISGLSLYAITKELEKRKLKAPAGGDKWHISTVRSILTNEKYRGDALLQKEYTAYFLEKT